MFWSRVIWMVRFLQLRFKTYASVKLKKRKQKNGHKGKKIEEMFIR